MNKNEMKKLSFEDLKEYSKEEIEELLNPKEIKFCCDVAECYAIQERIANYPASLKTRTSVRSPGL